VEDNDDRSKSDFKLKDIDDKMTILQDMILKMKINFDLLLENQTNKDIDSHVIESAELMLNRFLDNRPLDCEVINQCTTLTQKVLMKVIRVYLSRGHSDADELMDNFLNSINSYYQNGICRNFSCLDNAKQILLSLKEFLDKIDQAKFLCLRNFLDRENNYQFTVGNEKKESRIMSALGNEIRLKILKELSKGSNHYTQIERILGLKGGHFRFHLNELINAELVQAGTNDKLYYITTKGLEALNMLIVLSR
jgi:DNA-binding transcriptional ArsR family regulator